ncbi:MAG: hypothetical protein BGN97_04040 [Microbacterium sp. 69-10]|uniref:hypothetical protein n=1 Tax=Microbacterium sp. 69-10 TaxID=1895783 RepID=UPI0009629DDE|nr:hypothetical protein [Microbacterium sp. 69-10]OJU41601.1 MAG: hypothetical protein BGN97_04040 [Microbacterium sp. 69-10]
MSDWRNRWKVIVASDVSVRDGIGWEFYALDDDLVWTVFREDGGEVPVFSATRPGSRLPSATDLRAMTEEAVSDLLAAVGLLDSIGWNVRNLSAALLLAAVDDTVWEGEEWATDGDDATDASWAQPDDHRTPFSWIRTTSADSFACVSIYQDDGVFGLDFLADPSTHRPHPAEGIRRPRPAMALGIGRIRAVEAIYDTTVEDQASPGLLSEVLLHGDSGTALLVAAEPVEGEWRLFDESVTLVPGLAAADALQWHPDRRRWTSTIN